MSRDLGRDVPDLEKLYAKKLWADFSYPIFDMKTLSRMTILEAPPAGSSGAQTNVPWALVV